VITKFRQKPIALLMTFLIAFSMILPTDSVKVVQAADQATLAAWDITSAPASSTVLATSGTVSTIPVAVTGSAITVSGSAITAGAELSTNATYSASSGYATGSMKTTGWNNGANTKCWQIVLSSKGFENLTFAAKTRSSSTGPRDFTIQYSTNGNDFIDAGTYQNLIDKLENKFATVKLPVAASNLDTLIIRLMMSSNISVKGEVVPSAGVSNINNILIQGTPIESTAIVGAVEASEPSGAILSTDLIALACVTTGAAITYSINDGAYTPYTESFSITEFPATMKVKATLDGLTDSVVTVYEYTQVKVAAVTASPNGGAINKGSKIELKCSTENVKIKYSIDEGINWIDYTQSFTLSKLPAKVLTKATLTGAIDSSVNELNFTLKTGEKYNIYFGQLHAHTANSDGLGTVEEAFKHASKDVYNLDFLAVTDHSNSLEDTAGTASITNGSTSRKWLYGQSSADAVTTDDFVGIYGYEMTWSNGTGHINTFNTSGFENRNLAKYKTSTGLLEYYNALKTVPTSMSQFNHPGDTFGDFNDFAHYDSEIDTLISLIEVGNGEGAVHGSGYFPSYEYYTRALDKGWHVAPTNNQDNHKGLWGDANTARSVVLADSLTRENIYDAMKNMRVYATEDNNLSIYYTLNDKVMGSVIDSEPSAVDIKVELEDAGKTPAQVDSEYAITQEPIGLVEVIVNGGKVAASQIVTASQATVDFKLASNYSYYYIRVTQADSDIAVTAPVWVGEVDKAGISKTSTTTTLPIKGEPLDITTALFNNESYDMNIKSLEYSINGVVIHTADLVTNGLEKVATLSNASYKFDYTSAYAGSINIDVKLVANLQGVEKIFTDVLKVQITDPSLVTKVVIDGSHRNDYVNGYYNGNMSNFITLGAKSQIQVKVATEITDEVLAQASIFMISAPLKKANFPVEGVVYNPQEFSDEFIAMVKRYVDKGGNLIICGIADYQDNTTKDASGNFNQFQTSTQLNKLLAGIGATTKINNDQVMDNDKNGGQAYRLYFTDYNRTSDKSLLTGISEGQRYSFYSGCSIILDADAVAKGTTTWLVKGHATTYSNDTSKTLPATPVEKGDVYALATEKLAGGGNMLIGGTVFTSNFEIQASVVDNYDDIYSNAVIINNLLNSVQRKVPTTTIAEARKGNIGDVFAIEGYVTAGTVDGNAFFDTIYIQDETGGMDIFPISDKGILLGQKMRIIGSLDKYQGDIELRVVSSKKISEDINLVTPTELTTKDAMDYETNGGKLVKITGEVTELVLANDSLSAFKIKDSSGVEARILVDGYILDSTGKDKLESIVKVGNELNAIGIVYYNPEGVNLRVRDRAEITLLSTPTVTPTPSPTTTPTPSPTVTPTPSPTATPTPSPIATPTTSPIPNVITKKTIYIGHKYKLKVTNLLEGDKISFSSNKKTVASVFKDGIITANKVGTATITTKVVQNGKTYTFKTKVTVINSNLTISNRITSLKIGEVFTFKTKLFGLVGDVTWTVNNEKIATITKQGKLKAIKVGTVKVTAKCGSKSVTCNVKIKK